ncbi:MAG: 16S rRNA (cytidine(1402)-2'-O)-methyltransferase [Deferribacteres bacterium]|nr:16S rRNA (cytidine(1402)-2'-O)-methyltransferase [candidate division KSB1 bacterium]MCB9502819.1 16S rRNA (cytidine(1402)-2'-O)-methyltransferase [Deferribacteres bacterium]
MISTPIGNLMDITFRAVETLQSMDVVAAEDTRHSGLLLKHYQIKTKLCSFHDFNKEKQLPILLRDLQNGKNVGLITDAGTPGISDPGFSLIKAAIEAMVPIVPIPGATAFVPALIASGLPLHRFVFEGFPPVKKGRKSFFEKLKNEERTIILYESPHRILKTVKDIGEYWGNRNLVIARELTKKFEEFIRGTVQEIIEELSQQPRKGEIVIIVDGSEPEPKKRKSKNET